MLEVCQSESHSGDSEVPFPFPGHLIHLWEKNVGLVLPVPLLLHLLEVWLSLLLHWKKNKPKRLLPAFTLTENLKCKISVHQGFENEMEKYIIHISITSFKLKNGSPVCLKNKEQHHCLDSSILQNGFQQSAFLLIVGNINGAHVCCNGHLNNLKRTITQQWHMGYYLCKITQEASANSL